jgi:hypothetical protein
LPGLSVINVAMKMVSRLAVSRNDHPPTHSYALENLTAERPDMTIGGKVSARYFPGLGMDQGEEDDGSYRLNEEERARQVGVIQAWFGAVPDGHMRFFHGTNSDAAESMVEEGVLESEFEHGTDFGPGFYCSKSFLNAWDYGENTIFSDEEGLKGGIIAFDVPTRTCEHLEESVLDGDAWKRFVRECRSKRRNPTSSAKVLVGRLSDPSKGYVDPQPSGDDLQYVFLKDCGNMLLEDQTKVKVAIFDVGEDDESDDSGADIDDDDTKEA